MVKEAKTVQAIPAVQPLLQSDLQDASAPASTFTLDWKDRWKHNLVPTSFTLYPVPWSHFLSDQSHTWQYHYCPNGWASWDNSKRTRWASATFPEHLRLNFLADSRPPESVDGFPQKGESTINTHSFSLVDVGLDLFRLWDPQLYLFQQWGWLLVLWCQAAYLFFWCGTVYYHQEYVCVYGQRLEAKVLCTQPKPQWKRRQPYSSESTSYHSTALRQHKAVQTTQCWSMTRMTGGGMSPHPSGSIGSIGLNRPQDRHQAS